LNHQPVHRFADWPNRDVPKGKPGVYLIYHEGRWIYIGMASANLYGRLNQHARGKRSGDQFCVYVGDRLVISKLSIDQMKGVFSGEYFLDDAIKEFVRSQLSYHYLVVPDDPTARAFEKHGLEIAKGQGAELLNSI
jgi:predicted GIY-YIG superfamily endonuclease